MNDRERSTLVPNGVDGATGRYLVPPLRIEELASRLTETPPPPPAEKRPRAGVDPRDLGQAGWGALLPAGLDPAVRDALEPLFALRREQAGGRFGLLDGGRAYRPGRDAGDLMEQAGIGPGPVDPDKMPYYLALVGGPEAIPYTVQHDLDLSLAVGRIAFDTPEEYRRYAESVVAAETGGLRRPRRAAFLAVRNPDDRATQMSCDGLAGPLARELERHLAERPGERNGWSVETRLAEAADRSAFEELHGRGAPAFLFTASHGVGFPADDPRQERQQGALICQDWQGPDGPGLPREHYFAAEDVPEDATPGGMISFHFACYGAGTPTRDSFAHRGEGPARELAPRPLVAPLPRRLLSHPNGGALAAIGHVDRAWSWSFVWGGEYQRQVFDDTLREIFDGLPVGFAMEHFAERRGQLSAMLATRWTRRRQGEEVDDERLVGLWTAANDAGAYVILGDPAVRLPVGGGGEGRRP